tara:strand:- start:2189 stop:3193 length:1005 start_codon:yes stop_codon:yes gene_type:complete
VSASSLPIVGIVPGDPNGIGPEILIKAWMDGKLHAVCRPVVIGDAMIMQDAISMLGSELKIQLCQADQSLSEALSSNASVLDLIQAAPFAVSSVRRGQDMADAGLVSGQWLREADRLACEGILQATVMGPISAKSMDMAGTLHDIASHHPTDPAYLLLRSGPLVIAHLTDHISLREVSAAITPAAVHRLISKLSDSLVQWGLPNPRIGVAGFNPHATGDEEDQAIKPAVVKAQTEGINVEGPISPDSIFRHCIEGRYEAVIAMYHDQGHIAIKTWGFSGNNVVFLGPAYPHTTVAHGVAYDLAGTGRADCSMLRNAILNAACLAAGKGFHEESA